MLLGTDALNVEHPVPASRRAHISHFTGQGGVIKAQQTAAMQAFISDISTGFGGPDVLDACLNEYDKFLRLFIKHTDFQPAKLNRREGVDSLSA